MTTENWIKQFENLFMIEIEKLPLVSSLSFSGGIESSCILFALMRLNRRPHECITFQVGEYESKDVHFAKKICEYYDVPLKIVKVPVHSKGILEIELDAVLRIMRFARNIDVQCCHAYWYMIAQMKTRRLITGFYEDIHYEANKKLNIEWRRWKSGEISRPQFDAYYNYGRACIYFGKTKSGTPHNYVIIEKFLNKMGVTLYCPFKSFELFQLSQKLTFEDTNFMNGKFKKKWFLTQVIFKNEFDHFGNAKNSNYMHTQGLKQYHRKVLLDGTPHKDTIAVYNRILRKIVEGNTETSSPTLF